MKRVLVSVLDWGLGHATRSIPIIQLLIEKKCEVIIAGSGSSVALLKHEFPYLKTIELPAYKPNYSKTKNGFVLRMAWQLPKFFQVISLEHKLVESLVDQLKIDAIISDNRYGCWSSHVPSAFICHQAFLQIPEFFRWLSPWIQRRHEKMIKRFSEWWIPDISGEISLSGELGSISNATHQKIVSIGPLTRFKGISRPKKFDVCVVLSGPEPQRSMLENILQKQLQDSSFKYVIVRGVFSSGKQTRIDHKVIDFASSADLEELIASSEVVVCRGGYSTIMDLSVLGSKAVLIPTPGQTEQEYLANFYHKAGIAFSTSQETVDVNHAVAMAKLRSGFKKIPPYRYLMVDAVNNLLKRS